MTQENRENLKSSFLSNLPNSGENTAAEVRGVLDDVTDSAFIKDSDGAEDVSFDPTGLVNITATDVQGALEEVDALVGGGGGGAVDSVNGRGGDVVLGIDDVQFEAVALPIVSGVVTWDVSAAPNAWVLLNENVTINLVGVTEGYSYNLTVFQDGVGGRTITWSGDFFFNGGLGNPVPAANALSVFQFVGQYGYLVGGRLDGGSYRGDQTVAGNLLALHDINGNYVTTPTRTTSEGRIRGYRSYYVTVATDVELSPETFVGSDFLVSGVSIRANATSSGRTFTLPNDAVVGDIYKVLQYGAYDVTFVAESGGTLVNRSGHTKIAGDNGVVYVECANNVGGTSAIWRLSGDTK